MQKVIPLNYLGRVELMYSIYQWKDLVNQKLIMQGNQCKSSPPFAQVLAKYDKLRATCNKKLGKCV